MRKIIKSVFLILLISNFVKARDVTDMSLEEKVGQLFIVHFNGSHINEQAKRLIKEMKIGGIIYYNWANDLSNPYQIQKMSKDLQIYSKKHISIPLFISVDQEGGRISMVRKGFTEFPSAFTLGQTKQPILAYQASYIMGCEMKAVGINMNFAPVVDVNNNPNNPVIGNRSFGNDPKTVTLFAKASVKGYLDAHIIPCLKHFPGHGDVTVDSHQGLPIIDKSYQEIDNVELYPYKALSPKVPVIMTAHILFKELDPRNCATLSPIILKTILRDKLNYKGVLITDSLVMAGVSNSRKNIKQVVLKAFKAGNDILLLAGKFGHKGKDELSIDEMIDLYHSLIEAVRLGYISEKRVDKSVQRILNLKKKMGLFDFRFPKVEDINKTLRKAEHILLVKKITQHSK